MNVTELHKSHTKKKMQLIMRPMFKEEEMMNIIELHKSQEMNITELIVTDKPIDYETHV